MTSIESPVVTALRNEGVGQKLINLFVKGDLTILETHVMNWLLKEGWDPYEEYFSDVEVSDVAKAVNEDVPTVKGVIGSLTKKGYVNPQKVDGTNIVYPTYEGYELDDEEKWI